MFAHIADPLQHALELHRAGRLADAEPLYRQIIAEAPHRADAWHLLGALCLQSGRAEQAIEYISRAIAIEPDHANFYSHLGAAYGLLGQHEAAVAALRRAVQIQPQAADIHFNLGTALRNAGRLEEAVLSFRHALAAQPQTAEAQFNLANTLAELQRYDEAETAYRAAIEVRPAYVKALINLANLLHQRERLDEALRWAQRAVSTDPTHANARVTLGTLLREAGRYDEAEAELREATALAPTMAEAHNNLGTVLQAQARFAEALACYDRALELNPELADAHFSRAAHRLRLGDLAGGLAEFEWRWKCKSYSRRQFDEPRWQGEPLAGRTILLHAEQGLGDTLQFIRFVEQVKQRGATVIAEVQPALHPLLAGQLAVDRLISPGQACPPYDLHCPLMSLPSVLGLSLDALWQGPYIAARPELVSQWRTLLGDWPATLRIGVCWQGNPQHAFDRQRSFPLEALAPLAAVDGVRLVSLQKGAGAEQLAGAPFDVVDLGPPLDASGPFVDTAAVIANVDLVVTADTALAHLAGALGAPTWIALSAHSDWRWLLERSDSPWYPSARLFRQARLDQWDDVFAAMAAELRARVQAR